MNISQDKPFLSIQPYRGTRDFFPDLQRKRNRLFAVWKAALAGFGFEEYDAPLLEPLELYAAKSSEEIVATQLYSFVDRGERKVALRPEMTPTLARMVAARLKQLPRPIRWFSVPRCMRYERPQRGRLREFDQLNVDIFGGHPFDEDLEILLVCAQIMKELGAGPGSFEIRLNDRRLINDFLVSGALLHPQQVKAAIALLDRRDKIPAAEFGELWESMASAGERSDAAQKMDAAAFIKLQADFLQNFTAAASACQAMDSPEQTAQILSALRDQGINLSEIGVNSLARLSQLKTCTQNLVPDLRLVVDLGIARGFDYYTGIVFEIFDTHPENKRALFGGGRYDNLVGAFANEKLPGVGFGVSDVSLLNFCEVHEIELDSGPTTDVAVLRFSEEDRMLALDLAAKLRLAGLKCLSPITEQKFGKQIQAAEKAGATIIAFRGEEEQRNNTFAIKWLATGEQETDLPMTQESFTSLAERLNAHRYRLSQKDR